MHVDVCGCGWTCVNVCGGAFSSASECQNVLCVVGDVGLRGRVVEAGCGSRCGQVWGQELGQCVYKKIMRRV